MRQDVVNMVGNHEGFSGKLYKCPAGKNTIGYGFNLDAIQMPVQVAELWLNMLLDQTEASLKKNIQFYPTLSDARKSVLIDMAYNLGIAGLLQFKNMLYAMSEKKFGTAADEMLQSTWAAQVKTRATRLAEMMRTGAMK